MLAKLLTMLRIALVCAIPQLATLVWAQAILKVGPGQAYTTIQSGINAAADGDTVLVSPGTYYENIDFKGKAITVINAGEAAQTIIDGSLGQNPTVVFRNNEGVHSLLNGFTIQGGGYDLVEPPAGSYGNAGILIEQASPVIANNVITHNYCYGIQSNGSSPQIVGNGIDNTLDPDGRCGFSGGSGISLAGSVNYYNSGFVPASFPAYVSQNVIQNNTQSGKDDAGENGGAGIAVAGAYVNITHNTIRNNQTLGDGGAILAYNTSLVYLNGNLIYGNQAGTDGAISLQLTGDSVGSFLASWNRTPFTETLRRSPQGARSWMCRPPRCI